MSTLVPPKIIKVKELLLKDNLNIPAYQRPYKWTLKNVNQLIDDIILHQDKTAYRIGTLVIHQDVNDNKEEVLNIVDGQQRSITLTMIAYAILKHKKEVIKSNSLKNDFAHFTPKLLELEFNSDISIFNIQNNYKEIERRIKTFDEKTINFFFNKCQLVQIILTDISEAFQFFDSQNSRGKDLEPHDLLKAFHLREMAHLSTEEKLQSVASWEALKTVELIDLFSNYLFRIRNWSKGYSARYYTKNEVDVFKGISINQSVNYPFAQLHKIAHFYTENYNKDYHRNIDENRANYPFQIDQVIINGKRFFEMIEYYKKRVDTMQEFENSDTIHNDNDKATSSKIFKALSEYEGRNRTGDRYVRNLFDCCLMYYGDKFGVQNTPKVIEKFFIWAYTLRLEHQAVQLASMDNHALYNNNIFTTIREAIHPNDLMNIKLKTLSEVNSTKTTDIENLFKELSYYGE
ncbi:DUF262 domain-containing protein [Flavobacterium psychrophilum]